VARFEESDERPNDPPPPATPDARKAEAMAIDDRDWPRITVPADRWAGSSRDLVVAATGVLVVVVMGVLHGAAAPTVLIGVFAIVAAVLVLRLTDRSEGVEAPSRPSAERVWPDTGMKAAVEALPDPCFIVDQRGLVRYANSTALQRGATARIGEPLSFFVRAPQLHDTLDGVRLTGEADEVEWQERGGAERWLAASITPVKMAVDRARPGAERVTFHLVYLEDRTEQHRVERMRVDFVANASHELRTPLASLTGFIETLQGPAKNDPNARDQFLGIMLDQARRMKRLIDDLLSLSRIEMRAHVVPDTPVDLTAIIRHVVDALAPVAAESKVNVELNLPAAPVILPGDRDELVQVASNLIENAIKYGADGERVEVTLEPDPMAPTPTMVFSVRDHGPGIAAEHLPRLTERFYRVDVKESRERKGTGLGLAIVKHIVQRHRGKLTIDSVVGQGATFQVRLPSRYL
jgi:two-component system phosphate regulon sensor histidine kinase PhoR